MRVDHGRADALVSEQFLDRADVVAIVEEVGGEGMPERVTARPFRDARPVHGVLHRALDRAFVQVVAASAAGLAVGVDPGRGEEVLPGRFPAGVRVFTLEGARQRDPAGAIVEVLAVLLADALDLARDVGDEPDGKHGDPLVSALAAPHRDFVALEIDILDPYLQRLEQPQPRAVEESGDEQVAAIEFGEDGSDFLTGKDVYRASDFPGHLTGVSWWGPEDRRSGDGELNVVG